MSFAIVELLSQHKWVASFRQIKEYSEKAELQGKGAKAAAAAATKPAPKPAAAKPASAAPAARGPAKPAGAAAKPSAVTTFTSASLLFASKLQIDSSSV